MDKQMTITCLIDIAEFKTVIAGSLYGELILWNKDQIFKVVNEHIHEATSDAKDDYAEFMTDEIEKVS